MSEPPPLVLDYLAHGIPVFPLFGKFPAKNCPRCTSRAPEPHRADACPWDCLTCHGFHAATVDPDVVGYWWDRWPTANVGIPTGSVSGFAGLDVDPRHGGLTSLGRLVVASAIFPPTRAAVTGGGGRHFWYRHPGDWLRCGANPFGSDMPGLDVKAAGGYLVAPPSVHPDTGLRYRWCADPFDTPVADWPPQWTRWLRPDPPPYRPRPATSSRNADEAALAGVCRFVADSTKGDRNTALNWAAYRITERVGPGRLDPTQVEAALIDAGLAVGLRLPAITATIRSGLGAARSHPRQGEPG